MTIPSFEGRSTQKAAVCHGAVDLRIVSNTSAVRRTCGVVGREWEGGC